MSTQKPTCLDCRCEEFCQSVRHHGKQVTKDIIFSCGARQRELNDGESSTGRIEFVGCGR